MENVQGERNTWKVISLTFLMMVVEIITGMLFGSMALLADGFHMATHTFALGITAIAYYYSLKHAHAPLILPAKPSLLKKTSLTYRDQ
ncbi:MAG: cation transporter [Thermodesulfobacteriota bacterium]